MTTTDPEHALLRAVLDAPDDDLPRLAYADVLEERGDDARAEFVRVQLELARLRRLGCHEGEECDATDQCAECGREVEAIRLEYREREMFTSHADSVMWQDGSVVFGVTLPGRVNGWSPTQVSCRLPTGEEARLLFRRGFVERVEMPTDAFLAHAKALFSRHPVTEVMLADREPYPNGGGQVWYDVGRDMKSQSVPASVEIPTFLFRLLSNWLPEYGFDRWRAYPDEAAALADLSRACVRHGRAEAGLTQLEEVRR